MFEREDWTLFRTLTTLGQKAGVPVPQIPAIVAKELVDNALDAAGACRIEGTSGNGFSVVDAGDGIPGDDDAVASLFSIGRPLSSSKLLRRPSRGALGNGLRVVAGAVLSTAGRLQVATRGRTLRLTPHYQTGETSAEVVGGHPDPGTVVTVEFGPTLPIPRDALQWAEDAILMATHGGPAYTGKTSPHWYDPDSFFELLQASGRRTVRELVAEFDGCAEPKAGKIAAEFKGRAARDLTRGEGDRLRALLGAQARVVNPTRLGYVGPVPHLPAGYARRAGSFSVRTGLGPETLLPVVVEAWADLADEATVRLFVNRTPAIAPFETWHSKGDLVLSGCGLHHKFSIGRRPGRLVLNVTTPFMPITSDGKAPNLRPLVELIGDAAQAAFKRVKRQSAVLASRSQPEGKASQKDVIFARIPEAAAKASGDGQYRFSLRQLYYAVRPFSLELLGSEPRYGWFADVVTDYEARHGEIPGMYRDPRGTLYHPHTGEEIPLGTLSVEQYRRPAWTFNKVLYCEKEGLFPILRETKWPERHDCALMTSKGFASRAARDLLDLLGDTDEELHLYCVHDADASGTLIYQALQEGTRARPGRKVHIVNLGLEPAEALAMGLQVEPVKREGGKSAPVASYVPVQWVTWLQAKRVELNAMTTPQFLAWLDSKFDGEAGKVIPPAKVLVERLRLETREGLRRRIAARILRRGRLDERVEGAMERLEGQIDEQSPTIREVVASQLEVKPEEAWSEPIRRKAEGMAAIEAGRKAETARPPMNFP